MIPDGRKLHALGHGVYLLSSLVSTAEDFQREELYQNAKAHGRTLSSYAVQLCELLLQSCINMYHAGNVGGRPVLPGTPHQQFPDFMGQKLLLTLK